MTNIIILQILILITGVGAIFLLGRRTYKPKILGCISGLISQGFWLAFYIHVKNNGENISIMYIIVIIYIITWIINMKDVIKNKGTTNGNRTEEK